MKLNPLAVAAALTVTGCQQGVDSDALDVSARYFLENGGLTVVSTSARPLGRPCLDSLDMKLTLPDPMFGTSPDLVDFVERHRLAKVTRMVRPSGREGVSLTPIPPYESNWIGSGDVKNFCFGKPTLVKAEVVADAKPITAGVTEPYIIAGTEARSTRLTFRLEDVPGGNFTQDLATRPSLLNRDALRPENYGKEITLTAALPTKVENYKNGP
ncbi:hypothetical protein [Deinococcus puniceus]|uniref:Lipoprotein n=1 Tax=Deinococcus puniceus TaxID=1182568 RepID=A0A172T6P8_9DEIO|nr:hypothetical protein [Deinococcus puniceus]ANE42660.1 hypothetical protein SU48_01570 [Deinococcus puniceus]